MQEKSPAKGKVLSCFCGGAVVVATVGCPDPTMFGFSELFLPVTSFATSAGTFRWFRSHGDYDSGGHFPPTASGRDICTLANCYLL
ncbi:MAG: hypothetical protein R3C11_29395 [Planctomycetaceae bacterium]